MNKEFRVSICHYGVGKSMKSHYLSKKEPSNVTCIIHFVARYEMCHFTKMINRYKNEITSVTKIAI